ncbi:AI-2E family transporter [Streptococcus sp. zg-86]|uniref:AI-2E family transporter n=1 Tax=Streptococcus zhangguiae TaxID=2664091 RepID=A0A6I4REW1_9STRE|nr:MULTISPECIES: AI-2E family transporter [unclassified Streptococcus]MTB64335.1 AI-2E family transporter [Streptococcus sp. zg-86]MTB90645.1 AI-2E family transporter [Streptococcus sp. zg-36]MWV56360.1 AI-2E family transporter [Streptococcus sp. zg-70]QTH47428.1 AI-2E family transporter [Streptococcus sp. zg-86]
MKKSSFTEKLLLISFAALVLLAVLNYSDIYSSIKVLLSSMHALFIGAIFAFILNVPMKKLEDMIEKVSFLRKSKRTLAIIGVLIAFILIVTGVVVIILPTLVTTVSQLVTVTNQAIPQLIATLQDSGFLSNKLGSQLNTYVTQFTDWSKLSGFATAFLAGLANNVTGIFSNVLTLIMAFFFTLSILGSKEQLQDMTVKLLQAAFPEKVVRVIAYIGEVIVETYDRFLMSQIVEAVIIGLLVFVSYSLFSIPYAGMAGILSGVLSFVPYIGPLSACLISALFVSVQNPWLALWSVVLFQIIQLIEGNVIYPRVVGQSVGLPTLFTLAAALIGGNLFGLLGMVFFTPIFAVIYRLVKEWTYARLEAKEAEGQTVKQME